MNNSSSQTIIGIIGGSGVYEIDCLENKRWQRVESSFGKPSDELLFGTLAGQQLVFLPRHGRGHKISPSEINFKANIDILKRVGVTDLIAVSAVGSLRDDLKPGLFVIVDQFVDLTFAREKSFFGTGLVAHVSMAHPVCNRLGNHLEFAAQAASIEYVRGGTYLVMEGPQFSSLAESHLYQSWNCDVIGMTNMPEAKLAREAEICYASVAMVTDFDCWHPNHDDVSVEAIIQVLLANADKARLLIKTITSELGHDPHSVTCKCRHSLEYAVITQPDERDPAMIKKLEAIAGRVLGNSPSSLGTNLL
jgi:5'-methylthioadenosine phosphorylase